MARATGVLGLRRSGENPSAIFAWRPTARLFHVVATTSILYDSSEQPKGSVKILSCLVHVRLTTTVEDASMASWRVDVDTSLKHQRIRSLHHRLTRGESDGLRATF